MFIYVYNSKCKESDMKRLLYYTGYIISIIIIALVYAIAENIFGISWQSMTIGAVFSLVVVTLIM